MSDQPQAKERSLPLPWIKFNLDHVHTHFAKLPLHAKGMALMIYCHLWSDGTVEEDMEVLGFICGCSADDVQKVWKHLCKLFERDKDGLLVSPYLEEIRTEQDAIRAKRRDAGKQRQKATFEPNPSANAQQMLNTCSPNGQLDRDRVRVRETLLVDTSKENDISNEMSMSPTSEILPFSEVIVPEVVEDPKPNGRMRRPTEEEVVAYLREKGYEDPEGNGEKFWNFYESNGWKVGKNPMKSWHSAVVTFKFPKVGQPSTSPQKLGSQGAKLRDVHQAIESMFQ